jgi:fumarate hydratase, class II
MGYGVVGRIFGIIIAIMIRRLLGSTRLLLANRRLFSAFREESDTFGPIQVPADRLWAAQTQRSLQNFDIARDTDRMPSPIVHAFGILKKSAAIVNVRYGLDPKIGTCWLTERTRLPVHLTR